MCLAYISSEKKKQEFLKEARKRGYIRVYKVCDPNKTGWWQPEKYKSGLHKAKLNGTIDSGWNVYLSLGKAKWVKNNISSIAIKVCYAKPSWLHGLSLKTKHATFTHLVFPDWDRGDMTIREFRQICKESKKSAKKTASPR